MWWGSESPTRCCVGLVRRAVLVCANKSLIGGNRSGSSVLYLLASISPVSVIQLFETEVVCVSWQITSYYLNLAIHCALLLVPKDGVKIYLFQWRIKTEQRRGMMAIMWA